MEEEKSTLEKYWDHLKKRLEDEKICITSRESVKESIVSYDVKHEMNYPGCALERICRYKLAKKGWERLKIFKDNFDCDVAEITMWQYAIAFPYILNDGRSIKPQEHKKLYQ